MAVLKVWDGTTWVPVGSGGVSGVTVTAPATVGGTAANPIVGVQAATAGQSGSLSAADYSKLAGIAAGADDNVLEDVTLATTTTALAVTGGGAGGIVAKVKALSLAVANAVAGGAAGLMTGADKTKLDGIATGAGVATSVAVTAPATNSGTPTAPTIGVQAASGSGPGSMAAADFTKLGGIATGAEVNALNDLTLASATTAVTVTGGGAGGIVAKVKAVSFTIANAVAGGAAGLLTGADKTKLDGVGAGAAVTSVAVTAPATNSGTGTAPNISVQAATTSAPGSLSAADKTKLDGLTAGAAVASVGVTAPATLGGTATAPVIGVQAASGTQPGSLTAADFTKLGGVAIGAQVNVLEDVTLASTTTALVVTNGAAGGLVGKVKAVSVAVSNVVAGGAAGLMTGADKTQLDSLVSGGGGVATVAVTAPATLAGTGANPIIGVQAATTSQAGSLAAVDKTKLDGVATGSQANVLEGVTGTAPIVAGTLAAKSQALSIVPATASVPGSMSAAHFARVTNQGRVLLAYVAATDLANGTALTANTWATIGAAQNFTVGLATSYVAVAVAGVCAVAASPTGAVTVSSRLLLDGATAHPLGGWNNVPAGAFGNPLAGAGTRVIGGLTAASHTVALQILASVASVVYCLPATAPTTYALTIAVTELAQ